MAVPPRPPRPVVRARLNFLMRRVSMGVDRLWAPTAKRISPPRSVPFDGDPRFALITVNFSTTRYLKLMLLTLSEQRDLHVIDRIVVVDNASRDGGSAFVAALASRTPRVLARHRRLLLYHAHGMRAGVRALDRVKAHEDRANYLLFCDADVIFRDPEALTELATRISAEGAVLIGEARRPVGCPDIQASFFAVRRDVYAQKDIEPLVHDGSPAFRQQASIADLGLPLADFPGNCGGFILHRGRSGVAAAGRFRRLHPYASSQRRTAHYMGVPDGQAIWDEVETRHRRLLQPESEGELLDQLESRFRRLGAMSRAAGA